MFSKRVSFSGRPILVGTLCTKRKKGRKRGVRSNVFFNNAGFKEKLFPDEFTTDSTKFR